ncbi:hypothetical protein LSM04_007098 [Trypanosoma melophagium]|uniref:uncharacterized protein n=1 Tax=Trypanosoma melophagium TaxID=715481 RepID=UPI003519F86E|nr:hypothetical protein LSM04_007098 [Trypanosoma melophagium]
MDEAFYHPITIRCGELSSLFSDDFPLFDDTSDIDLMPLKYGVSGEAFSAVLDFLRYGEWQPMLQQSFYQDAMKCIERLELCVIPPPSPDFTSVERNYNCMEVIVPGEGKGVSTTLCVDVCAELGMRGYRVWKQLQGTIPQSQKGTERNDTENVTLLMERQLPAVPRLVALSSCSTWVNALTREM